MKVLDVMTTSRARCAHTCLRKHYFQYELGLRPATAAKPLRMGSAIHEMLDSIKCGCPLNDALATGAQKLVSEYGSENYAVMLEAETVLRMVHGWAWRWQNDGLKVLHSEHTYHLPLPHPTTGRCLNRWRTAGQIDGIVQREDGSVWLLEHKTCGEDISPDAVYWDKLHIDLQLSNYYMAAKKLGHDVQGVIFDVLRKPDIRPKQVPLRDADGLKVVLDQDGNRVMKADGKPRQSGDVEKGWSVETVLESIEDWGARFTADIYERPDHYFARRDVVRFDHEIHEARVDMYQTAKVVTQCRKADMWPRNDYACTARGRCPYLSFCSGYEPLDQDVPDGFEIVSDVHPELKGK